MKKKKINHQPSKRLVLILSVFPQRSETFIVSKFLGLISRGWDVHIYCRKQDRNSWTLFPELDRFPGIKKKINTSWPINPRWLAVLLFPFTLIRCFILTPKTTWRYLRNAEKMFGLGTFKQFYLDAPLICMQPDIIHFEFGSLAVDQAHLKAFLNARFTVSFRGYDLNYIGLDKPKYYDQIWKTIDKAHFLGEDLWKRARRRGAPQNLSHNLIPPAVDLLRFPNFTLKRMGLLGTTEHPFRILSIGRLHWKKGYEFSLLAVKSLIDQGVYCEYRIIGDGEFKDCLFFTCHQLGINNNVRFCGGLPHDIVLDHLHWTDVFLHGAVSEGFCNAVLEAQAMGVPVICTNADGLGENIQDGITGFVVPRREHEALAKKMERLATDAALRKRMGAAGRKRIEDQFGMDQQLDAFEGFYEQL